MPRYAINTPLVAIRLHSPDSDQVGIMTSLPSDAIVEIQGPSDLGRAMVEVSWQDQRYAVFELDLATRATPEPTEEAIGEETSRRCQSVSTWSRPGLSRENLTTAFLKEVAIKITAREDVVSTASWPGSHQ
jgi:hypothetical protein